MDNSAGPELVFNGVILGKYIGGLAIQIFNDFHKFKLVSFMACQSTLGYLMPKPFCKQFYGWFSGISTFMGY